MTEVVELEVGRFALRTFNIYNGKLHPIIARGSGQHWDKGVCQARCVLFDDVAFATTAAFRTVQYEERCAEMFATLEAKASTTQGWEQLQGFAKLVEDVNVKLLSIVEHKAPDRECWCGVYGSLDLANLRKQYTQSLMFVAVIAAEGKTIIGSRGLRTEYARIAAYWTPWYHYYARRVAGRECPEAQSYKDLNEMLKDYGIPRKANSDTPPSGNALNWWTA